MLFLDNYELMAADFGYVFILLSYTCIPFSIFSTFITKLLFLLFEVIKSIAFSRLTEGK